MASEGSAAALVFSYLNRAAKLLGTGYASASDIDTAMRLGCGLPSGPFAMIDMIGADVVRGVLARMHDATGDPSFAPAPLFAGVGQPASCARATEPVAARRIDRAGVVGTGTMARGIAEVAVTSGLPVVLVGRDHARAERAVASIAASMERSVGKGRMTETERDRALGLLTPAGERGVLAGADLVVEAVVEDLAVKRELFADLGRICAPGAVLATTTSSLPVAECAAASGRPREVVGLHFFNPAPAMRLVEVVRTGTTSADVVATALALCTRMDKTGVECGDRTGFIVNYLLFAYLNRAVALLGDGADADPEAVDTAVTTEFGYPLGPFALLDVIGLDVSLAILRELHRAFPEPDFLPARQLDELVAAGRLGRKTGGGFR
ncbi:3-hydroxyacyl-CoA dehydrogenase NAD-binding domain-containing protein [Actinophytocola sp.]|uniref:3-hydroxyacyl-CoA dehydrogenase NAD-binding domain-containing protein n=1 Tax=Actinophytocola sp. TaxID=1872138 RepID=UPI003C710CC2